MSHWHLRLFGNLSILALAAAPAAQAPGPQNTRDAARPTTGTAVLAGTLVSDDETSRPIRHALVSLNAGDIRDQRATATDDLGRFAFASLPAGHYSLSASRPGYCTSYYGAKVSWRAPSSPITLEDGQQVTVAMKMLHGAVIAGTIVDAYGHPQPGVRVSTMGYRTVGGVRRAEPFFGGGGLSQQTDDRGEYRIYGLIPGDYSIVASASGPGNAETRIVTNDEIQWAQRLLQHPGQAVAGMTTGNPSPPPGPPMGYAPVYFPGTADASAAAIVTLAAAEERNGVDFALQWVATAKVSGTIADAEGRPAPSVSVNLVAKQMLIMIAPFSGRGTTDPRGNFSFAGVTPGEYTVLVRSAGRADGPPGRAGGPAPPRPILWAQQDVTVRGEDVTGLSLALQPALSVSGRLVFDGTTPPPPDLSKIRVSLGPAPTTGTTTTTITMGGAPPEINADGTFTLTGATPGRYRLNASVPGPLSTGLTSPTTPAWSVKSILSGGVETLDSALEISTSDLSGVVITFTDRPTELSGRLVDGKGKPTPEYWVVAFTTDRTFWTPGSRRVRTMKPDAEGKFKLIGLPPGEYYMVALTELDQADMTDASFLEQLAAASFKITLGDGEKKTLPDLKLSGGG
jgi:hypothetical protein